jgi:DNA-binding NarL/FixJ family response regulator
VRVVVAEDHALLRAGLVELMTGAGLDVVGQAGDADELLAITRQTLPDVVLVDIRMPPTHTLEGLAAARTIRAEHGTAIGVVVLSQHVETHHAVDLIAEGASGFGYLLKDRVLEPAELIDAIRRVADGGSAIDPTVVQHLMKRRRADGLLDALTDRERDVLAAMAEGRSNQSIAHALTISTKTVEAATSRIFMKLGLDADTDDHRRVCAVLVYLRATADP